MILDTCSHFRGEDYITQTVNTRGSIHNISFIIQSNAQKKKLAQKLKTINLAET